MNHGLIQHLLIYIGAFGITDIVIEHYNLNKKQRLFVYVLLIIIGIDVFKK
uniref:Uncharacterized protein n=1 Tax=viral metagenome TaxID=1070528 RepID=A0A6C0L1J8_9ZZZZ